MRILIKFNLILIVVFGVLLSGASRFVYIYLEEDALKTKQEAQKILIDHTNTMAAMMMESALAVRHYTVTEIRPLLKERMKTKFLPQSVPAYAATQIFNKLREKYSNYAYKEATINPTNPRNRATDWETDIITDFRNKPDHKVLTGTRKTPTGDFLYVAKPITIKKKGCLSCHDTAARAPKTMLTLYGSTNGFGWKMNEVVGAQIISVPMPVPVETQQLKRTFTIFMTVSLCIFLLIMVILNATIYFVVVRPINNMATLADRISKGDLDTPEFAEKGKDEVSIMAAAFNRMRRSLEKAIKMIEETSDRV